MNENKYAGMILSSEAQYLYVEYILKNLFYELKDTNEFLGKSICINMGRLSSSQSECIH
jgi:hypothetical protein